jgi:hypothetical protein
LWFQTRVAMSTMWRFLGLLGDLVPEVAIGLQGSWSKPTRSLAAIHCKAKFYRWRSP